MLQDLLAFQNGAPETEEVRSVPRGTQPLAFGGELEAIADPLPAILQQYSRNPRADPLHRVDGRARTSFEEQLGKRRPSWPRRGPGPPAFHTVSPEHARV